MKKSDILFLVFSLAVLVYVLRDHIFLNSVWATKVDKQGYHLVLMLDENDCIECIQKSMCSFQEILDELNNSSNVTCASSIFFANHEGGSFNRNQLEDLCQLPENIYFCKEADLDQTTYISNVTPSVLLLKDARIIFAKPIFVNTDMNVLQHDIKTVFTDLQAFLFSDHDNSMK